VQIVRFETVAAFSAPGLTDKYYTAAAVPSWERDAAHDAAVRGRNISIGGSGLILSGRNKS
jgi:hypothetical protein